MELKKIQALMRDFEDSDTRELQLDDGEFHLYLSKNKRTNSKNRPISAAQKPVSENQKSTASSKEKEAKAPAQVITAPLVGTVYLQPKPDANAYVQVGDHIKPGQVVCVIEAMKMMTEIKSELSGVITQVNVKNEELVEVEQPLFTVAKEENND